jgi:ABC-type maltose transport system permease subunit
VVLQLYLNQYNLDYGVFLASTALAMLPPALLFLALQKEFIGGLTSGAVKG